MFLSARKVSLRSKSKESHCFRNHIETLFYFLNVKNDPLAGFFKVPANFKNNFL